MLVLSALALCGQNSQSRTFRQWMGGQEVGGSVLESQQSGDVLESHSREWMVVSRVGLELRQEIRQTSRKLPKGDLAFTWRLDLSSEPFQGQANWSPLEPKVLALHPANGPAVRKEVPDGALLWPEDLEARLREAARSRGVVQVTTFAFPVQQWNTLRLEPRGSAPLPGFPDAVRFTGEEQQGTLTVPVEVWISPSAGELRHRTHLGGLEVLTQRAELPAPAPPRPGAEGLFERTLQTLPPHPLQPWIRELTIWGKGALPKLPEDAQQTRLPHGRWRLRRASLPTLAEAAQPPLSGPPAAAEARYLNPSPLVPFQDPAFEGLLKRMALPPGLSRWSLAQRVNAFVFEWITEKDFSVGFASALEVCHHPRGDCTEHGVLAVALLRRLGVPARGVTGWVALGDRLGLHFWVEIRLGTRWIPLDPTFDQAPASAFRIKLADSDLADLGSVGWEGAATAFSGVHWVPEREGSHPWGKALTMLGDAITSPSGVQLRLPGGRWEQVRGGLQVRTPRGGPWRVLAMTRPSQAQIQGARLLAGARTLRRGWWNPSLQSLWMDLGGGHWLRIENVRDEDEAFELLDQLMVAASAS